MMSQIEKLSTERLPARKRLDYWNDVATSTYDGTSVDFHELNQNASMSRWRLGSLSMMRARSDALVVQRKWPRRAEDKERLVLHLPHRGSGRFVTRRNEVQLDHTSFAISSALTPYRIEVGDKHELLVVEFQREELEARLPDLDSFLERGLVSRNPSGSVLHDFLLSMWRHGELGQFDANWGLAMSRMFIDLVSLSLQASIPMRTTREPLRQRVLAFVKVNLCDPALNTACIARTLGVSDRTVQGVFSEMSTTPTAYILEQRLILAAEQLRVPSCGSITNIALDVGFNDSSYFARCFRTRFGASPGSWRTGAPAVA